MRDRYSGDVAIIRPDLHYVQQTGTKAVATTTRTPTTALPARPFDARRSAKLDDLVLQLETTNPHRWRRRILQLKKLIAERNVPAFHSGRAR